MPLYGTFHAAIVAEGESGDDQDAINSLLTLLLGHDIGFGDEKGWKLRLDRVEEINSDTDDFPEAR